MFDIGFTELLVVGIVALIVVGPKDLPGMFRTLGRFTARARALGREFTSAMNAAANESGMKEASKELKGLTSPRTYGLDKLNEAADRFDKWDPMKPETSEEKPAKKPIDPERQADIEKIREATQRVGQARLDREKAEKAAAEAATEKPVRGKPPERPKPKAKAQPEAEAAPAAKKPAARKPAASKPAAKKTAAKAKSADTAKPASKPAPVRKAPAKKKTTAKAPATSDKADDA